MTDQYEKLNLQSQLLDKTNQKILADVEKLYNSVTKCLEEAASKGETELFLSFSNRSNDLLRSNSVRSKFLKKLKEEGLRANLYGIYDNRGEGKKYRLTVKWSKKECILI